VNLATPANKPKWIRVINLAEQIFHFFVNGAVTYSVKLFSMDEI
jgi:predicted membrane channel-forming protein YqfA (hemolysin III family)